MTGLVRPSSHKGIVYELKPGVVGTFRNKPFRTNSHGLRDSEYGRHKPAGTYRIVGLGDSVMFGWGVAQGEPYLEVLERRLNARSSALTFETLDFAVPGYNTAIEVTVFEHRALAFDPDLVVLQFVNNDMGVPMFMEWPHDSFSLRRCYLKQFVHSLRYEHAEIHRRLVGSKMNGMEQSEKDRVRVPYGYMCGEAGFRLAMKKLAALTKPRGIPVIIIQGTASSEQKALLKSVAGEHGFHLLDIKPYTDAYVTRHGIPNNKKARRKALWVSSRDRHPNAAAHTIYADGIEDQMRTLGIIE